MFSICALAYGGIPNLYVYFTNAVDSKHTGLLLAALVYQSVS